MNQQIIQQTALTAWEKVGIARSPKRAKAMSYMSALFHGFHEFHGDRAFGDDGALVGGIGWFHDIPVTVLAQAKGCDVEENMQRNFGMMHPEGYRKAMRLAKQAEKFHRPIIALVDTAGAYPGKGAEERGQANAIAECLHLFANLRTPVISIVLSEGGSGGALALSVGDRIIMLEHAVYSILSPEGFASILWKDGSRAEEAASLMELTAQDLHAKGIVDQIIYEPPGGVEQELAFVVKQLDQYVYEQLQQLKTKKEAILLKERYQKYRRIGL